MLGVGNYKSQNCGGVTRRHFLQLGASLPVLSGLSALPVSIATAAQASKAKSVLMIWLVGGPSHLDLFDPKPDAAAEYRGPFAAIKTKTPSVQFSELLPKMAARSDQFSLVRTNINYDGGHRPAGSISWTGGRAVDGGESGNGTPRGYPPNFGSVVARTCGGGQLPPFLSLAKGPVGDGIGPSLGYGGNKWGPRYDPFMVHCSRSGEVSIPGLKLLEGLSPMRLADRRQLLEKLNNIQHQLDRTRADQLNGIYRQAYDLLTNRRAIAAFDLSREPEKLRARYGKTSFGQSCLLGRRLVEAGVRYVQINWSQYAEVFYPFSDYGWDTHADNFQLLADWHGPLLDHAFSTLLDDLRERGLLDTTLVVCMGEFGRTPRINSIGSRDHWHKCYFSVWAGGGVQPGRVIGKSDPRGELPTTKPITPEMVGSTILELVGVDTAKRAELQVIPGGEIIDELL